MARRSTTHFITHKTDTADEWERKKERIASKWYKMTKEEKVVTIKRRKRLRSKKRR